MSLPPSAWSDAKPTWAVVLVHGVGDTSPGATLEAFVPSFLEKRGTLEEIEPPQVVLLPEDEERFPVHLRRATVTNPQPGKPEQAAFAEVFWSDLSKTGEGALSLLLRVLTLVFHMRYLTDQAAAFPHWPGSRWLRFLLYLGSGLLCGPIAACYLVLLGLLALRVATHAIEDWFPAEFLAEYREPWLSVVGLGLASLGVLLAVLGRQRNWPYPPLLACILVAGAGAFAASLAVGRDKLKQADVAAMALTIGFVGIWLWRRSRNYEATWGGTWRWLLTCVTLAAFTVAAYALVQEFFDVKSLPALTPTTETTTLRALKPLPGRAFAEHIAGLFTIISWSIFVLMAITSVAMILWLLLRLKAWSTKDREASASLDAAICSALIQIGLWGVIVHPLLLFALGKFRPDDVPGRGTILDSIYISFLFHLVFGLAVVLAVLAVAIERLFFRGRWQRAADKAAFADAAPRLIVHPWVRWALLISSALGCATSLYTIGMGEPPLSDHVKRWSGSPEMLLPALTFMVLVIGMILQKPLRLGLHIVMDIVSHFYRPNIPFPWPFGKVEETDIHTFTIQQRIEKRFKRVMHALFDLGNVTHITFVTHSQGTVIALNVLWYRTSYVLLKKRNNVQEVNLVTMGSPVTHLYHQYFPDRYPALFVNGQLSPEWGEWLNKTVDNWVNLYRVDDPIGTYIDQPGTVLTFPRNDYLGLGGHNDYWNDERALVRMERYLPG